MTQNASPSIASYKNNFLNDNNPLKCTENANYFQIKHVNNNLSCVWDHKQWEYVKSNFEPKKLLTELTVRGTNPKL